ncbi:formiminoglutamase [Filimonas lacunae]|uniref:Formiminoglutamase n=1 Tax=Filimonas lacunae TaxID=477680 RepID=A0A173MFP9_9BACT|nr:formimidoylglutamase [Filimonas lacunae]BAV06326.1 formiminoglutamase [Filimonas lacunae]SIT25821.1 formiminoglutamase [Filimonas lacunae]
MKHLKLYTKEDILAVTRIRKFETKLGECVQVLNDFSNIEASLLQTDADYIIVGIPEDIGVKANMGAGGADTAWLPFLRAFLNVQSNDFLQGLEVLVLGHFDFSDMSEVIETNALTPDEKIEAYRHAVRTIDDEVENIVKLITQCGKIPIVIGGGHNNAYPCIKGAAKGLYKAGMIPIAQINAINLDAHADYRPSEGRHSGNAFRYAEEDNFLEKYCIIGLHENYLTQNTWMDMVNNPFMDVITFEDIFLHEKHNFLQAIAHAAAFTEGTFCGIELDMDSIEQVLSSAITPTGIKPLQARQYVHYTAMDTKVAYLHICEGATQLADGRRDDSTGKLISYLVTDFVKSHQAVLNGKD